jgi:hypothetical protein
MTQTVISSLQSPTRLSKRIAGRRLSGLRPNADTTNLSHTVRCILFCLCCNMYFKFPCVSHVASCITHCRIFPWCFCACLGNGTLFKKNQGDSGPYSFDECSTDCYGQTHYQHGKFVFSNVDFLFCFCFVVSILQCFIYVIFRLS